MTDDVADDVEPPAWQRVRALLSGCALTCPSGVVQAATGAQATLYLADGMITYAEPGSVPGLGMRLVADGRLDWQRWGELRTDAMAGSDLPTVLLAGGVIGETELRATIRATIIDALFELLTADDGGQPRATTIPVGTGWTGSLVRLDVGAAVDEAARAVRETAGLGLSAGDVPVPLDPGGDVVLTDVEWLLRWQLDGRQSLRQLAWRTGLSLVDVVRAEAGLVGSGLCSVPAGAGQALPARPGGPVPAEPGAVLPVGADVPVEGPEEAVRAPGAALPRRQPVRRPWDAAAVRASGGGAGTTVALTDVRVLERVLQRLRSL